MCNRVSRGPQNAEASLHRLRAEVGIQCRCMCRGRDADKRIWQSDLKLSTPLNAQEQQRRETVSEKSVQATPATSAGATQTANSSKPTSTQTTAVDIFVETKTRATQTIVKNSLKKTASKSRKSKPKESGAKSAPNAFAQRLKDRLTKTQAQLKQTASERDEHRRNNYQLNQTNKRLMVLAAFVG